MVSGRMTSIEMELPTALSQAAAVVEATLETLLPAPEGAEARLADAMRYATLCGGKRLRAFLVVQSAALFAVSQTCAARVSWWRPTWWQPHYMLLPTERLNHPPFFPAQSISNSAVTKPPPR